MSWPTGVWAIQVGVNDTYAEKNIEPIPEAFAGFIWMARICGP
jgi:hypothetical protein